MTKPRMRGLCVGVLVGATTLASMASAQTASWGARPSTQPTPSNVRLGLQLGLTSGGDTLASATFSGGQTETIKAGGLIHFAAGVVWTPPEIPFAGQFMMGYHVDSISADNGDLRFSRYPFELLALYTGAGKLRLGAGLRYVLSPNLKVDVGGVSNTRVDYQDTVGVIAEVGWQFSPTAWLALRSTFENYKVSTINGNNVVSTGTIDGNSVGLYVGVAF